MLNFTAAKNLWKSVENHTSQSVEIRVKLYRHQKYVEIRRKSHIQSVEIRVKIPHTAADENTFAYTQIY